MVEGVEEVVDELVEAEGAGLISCLAAAAEGGSG